MKKLYIPTTTFNFNNILSSESISPHAFYGLRGYGYPRWMNISENNFENVILLYKEPFCFCRPQSDIEDHPMLIEITTDKDFPTTPIEGILYSDRTIYLTPWNTMFIFFCEEDKRTTLSLSDSSLETKLVNLYQKRIEIRKDYSPKEIPSINLDVKLNTNEIERDQKINKMKGLLTGYYIGAKLSMPDSITKKRQMLSELWDIFSSVISSEDHYSALQDERIDEILKNIVRENPVVSVLQPYLADKDVFKFVEEVLLKIGWTNTEYTSLSEIKNSLYSKENNLNALNWLKEQCAHLAQEENSNIKPLSPNEEEIIVSDSSLSTISSKCLPDCIENNLFCSWVNEILSSTQYNGNVSVHSKGLSDAITLKAKEIIGDKWSESKVKENLNQIRRYVGGMEASIDWNNLLTASVASVLVKGDDWENLRSFMIRKSISNYRIAFAIYGILNGYANLTRDFTDNLYGISDKKYVADVYKEFYGQLFGEDICVEKFSSNIEKDEIVNTPIINGWKCKVDIVVAQHKSPKLSEEDKTIICDAKETAQDKCDFIQKIKPIRRKKIGRALIEALNKENDLFGTSNMEQDESRQKNDDISYAEDSNRKKISEAGVSDIISTIRKILCQYKFSEKTLDCLEKDVKWSFDPKYTKGKSSEELLKSFQEHLIYGKTQTISAKGKPLEWKNKLYRELDIDAIIRELKQKYD